MRPVGPTEINAMLDALEVQSLRGKLCPERFEMLLFEIEELLGRRGRIRERNRNRAWILKYLIKQEPCLSPAGKELFAELGELLRRELL